MTEHSLWRFARVLHDAITHQQIDELAPMIADDIDWAIYGPIDMFSFLGARCGKAAVLDVCRQIVGSIRIHRIERESVMLGVDSGAAMMRFSITALHSNRPISLRLAQFARFKADQLLSMRVVIDTFDLVEQALGQPIHLPHMA